MRQTIWHLAAMIVVLTVEAAHAQQATPTTRPTDAPALGTGIIRGRVTIKGGGPFTRPDLSRVVVYLASSESLDPKAGPTTRAVVSQKDKTFVPSFLVVPRGQEVEFPNWDRFDHNVFSRSAAAPAFDLDRYPYGQSKARIFDKLGVVQVFCNIHPDMRAVIFVVPNSSFARADRDGNFQITGLPAGAFEVVAWHERCEERRQAVQVVLDSPVDITLALQENRESVLTSTGDRRGAYGVERGLGVKREQLDLPVVQDSHPAPPESRP